jgi:hypothetical protein
MTQICYYGDKISPHMALTPEGFLICKDVPIARTGYQHYLESELYEDGNSGTVINVFRPPSEVFSRETLASFEGKPVTNGHPDMDVTPENYHVFAKGHVQHVRPGQGDDSNKIIADLYITDKGLIEEIRNGKREVSAGYYADDSTDDEGRVCQTKIRGNHVAVVDNGRAGPTVAIRDSANGLQRRQDVNETSLKKSLADAVARNINASSSRHVDKALLDGAEALVDMVNMNKIRKKRDFSLSAFRKGTKALLHKPEALRQEIQKNINNIPPNLKAQIIRRGGGSLMRGLQLAIKDPLHPSTDERILLKSLGLIDSDPLGGSMRKKGYYDEDYLGDEDELVDEDYIGDEDEYVGDEDEYVGDEDELVDEDYLGDEDYIGDDDFVQDAPAFVSAIGHGIAKGIGNAATGAKKLGKASGKKSIALKNAAVKTLKDPNGSVGKANAQALGHNVTRQVGRGAYKASQGLQAAASHVNRHQAAYGAGALGLGAAAVGGGVAAGVASSRSEAAKKGWQTRRRNGNDSMPKGLNYYDAGCHGDDDVMLDEEYLGDEGELLDEDYLGDEDEVMDEDYLGDEDEIVDEDELVDEDEVIDEDELVDEDEVTDEDELVDEDEIVGDDDSDFLATDEDGIEGSPLGDSAIRRISAAAMKIRNRRDRQRVQDAILWAVSGRPSQMNSVMNQIRKQRRDSASGNIDTVKLQKQYDKFNPHKANKK